MKHRMMILRLIALLLALSLLLSGCMGLDFLPELLSILNEADTTENTAEPEEQSTQVRPTRPTNPGASSEEALIRWQNAGQKDYLPDKTIDMVVFSEMKYIRPDVETLYADFDALIQEAKTSRDVDALLERYYDLYSRYISFYSMDSLANIRYSLNTRDSAYKDEYDFCEAETPNLEEKFEALNKAFAASPSRYALERKYFGMGYFLQYDDYEVYTNPEYLRLSQEEAALLSEYRELSADPQVTYRGETKSLDDWLASDSYEDYFGSLKAYYQQYNQRIGELFVKLVKVRRQLAQALEYDSYAEYSYAVSYQRDYSPEQGDQFLRDIREYLVPVLEQADEEPSLSNLRLGSSTETKMMDMLRSAAENIGGAVWDAFRFMQAYELCDIAKAPEKVEASFQTYIYDYEAPFVLVNASGSGEDYTTFSHEFGHFTDSYYSYGANEDLETAETFSQAMEFLALKYTDTLNESQKKALTQYKLLDALETFVYQGAYAEFEAKVYALDPAELTVEKINELFRQACRDYGIYQQSVYGYDTDFYYSLSWIDVIHFFEVPYYIISYCVSAETALQVYQLETEAPGSGVEAYFRLLDRDFSAGVQQVMEDAKLQNPFREEVLEHTAAFFNRELGLE